VTSCGHVYRDPPLDTIRCRRQPMTRIDKESWKLSTRTNAMGWRGSRIRRATTVTCLPSGPLLVLRRNSVDDHVRFEHLPFGFWAEQDSDDEAD
jgi:hypothetical protein